MKQLSFFSLPDHLSRLSASGYPLEVLASCVDFEIFSKTLNKGLLLGAQHNLSDEKVEFLIRDRLKMQRWSWPFVNV